MPARYRRTHFINDLSLQLRYILVAFLILAAYFGISLWVVYLTGWQNLVERLSMVYPQGRLSEILGLIYFRMALGFLLMLPVTFGMTLFLSHTIAGPLVRIKRYLRLMAKGEFDLAPIALRRFDELKDVAQLINEITAHQGPHLKERRNLMSSLQATLAALRADLQRLPSVGQEIHRKVNFLADSLRVLE